MPDSLLPECMGTPASTLPPSIRTKVNDAIRLVIVTETDYVRARNGSQAPEPSLLVVLRPRPLIEAAFYLLTYW